VINGACYCPEAPAIGPTDPVPTGPIRCVCCGEPLELSCAKQCAKVAESIAAAVPPKPRKPRKALDGPRSYAPKPCARCGNEFQPTGPRASYCASCKAVRT
jgi:hypothetical protein